MTSLGFSLFYISICTFNSSFSHMSIKCSMAARWLLRANSCYFYLWTELIALSQDNQKKNYMFATNFRPQKKCLCLQVFCHLLTLSNSGSHQASCVSFFYSLWVPWTQDSRYWYKKVSSLQWSEQWLSSNVCHNLCFQISFFSFWKSTIHI